MYFLCIFCAFSGCVGGMGGLSARFGQRGGRETRLPELPLRTLIYSSHEPCVPIGKALLNPQNQLQPGCQIELASQIVAIQSLNISRNGGLQLRKVINTLHGRSELGKLFDPKAATPIMMCKTVNSVFPFLSLTD